MSCYTCNKKEKVKALWEYVESALNQEWEEKFGEPFHYPQSCWVYWGLIAQKSRYISWKNKQEKRMKVNMELERMVA